MRKLLLLSVATSTFDEITKYQSPPQPLATRKTLTELTEEMLDYDEDNDDLSNMY